MISIQIPSFSDKDRIGTIRMSSTTLDDIMREVKRAQEEGHTNVRLVSSYCNLDIEVKLETNCESVGWMRDFAWGREKGLPSEPTED